jgi:lipoprotein-anchoring transpeptidase ErfK/SrfK
MRQLAYALLVSACAVAPAVAEPAAPIPISPFHAQSDGGAVQPVRYAAAQRPNLGGGFIEALFGGAPRQPPAQYYYRGGPAGPAAPAYESPRYRVVPREEAPRYQARPRYDVVPGEAYEPGFGRPSQARLEPAEQAHRPVDPRYRRQVVDYDGNESPGTIVVDTRERFLYLVQSGGRAIRYGIGVGRPGFTWAGIKHITQKREWPDWRPPPEMLKRRPDLPRYMAGGPDNPLGARALYLGSSLYRIHGSNEPWTIGMAVSSGCIRMRNEDVIDLYDRVTVGTKVRVI